MINNSKNITKKDISKSIFSKFGTSEKTISSIVDDIFNIFKIIIVEERKLNLKNIGTFSILNKSKRTGRNPKTGNYHLITERKSLSFKVSDSLKNKINNDYNDR